MVLTPPLLDDVTTSLADHGYSLGDFVGSGSFGSVYRVKSIRFEQQFCVKILMRRSGHLYSEESFLAEFESLLRLSHPSIVRLYNVWSTDACHFLILEYISQGSIERLTLERHGLPDDLVWTFGSQILSGLIYCHSKNFCHGDIKPANILLDDFGHGRLADFGLSGTIALLSTDRTQVRGSVGFLPPERLLGTAMDPRAADVWALGVTFFMMATGSLPWSNESLEAAVDQIRSGKVDFPPTMNSDLQHAIRRMLTVDERKRPTMEDALQMPFFQNTERLPSMPSVLLAKELPKSGTLRARPGAPFPPVAKRLPWPFHAYVTKTRRGWGSLDSPSLRSLPRRPESWVSSEL
jgi:serine/threonine protein kinase